MPNVDRLGGTGVLSRKRHMHCQGDGQHTLLWYSERRTGGQSPLTGDMTASAGLGVLRERTRRFCICLSDFYSERRKLPPGPRQLGLFQVQLKKLSWVFSQDATHWSH